MAFTLKDLHAYHAADRQLFARLVITLMRNPAEALLIMALWLWLEEKGYHNIINTMVELSNSIVTALAEEAVSCLNCLQSESDMSVFLTQNEGRLRLTETLTQKHISLRMFYQKRFTAIGGIKSFLNTVCARIFTDILQYVLVQTRQVTIIPNQTLVVPGFPHPVFGSFHLMARPLDYDFAPVGVWGWRPDIDVSEDDRTMFLTFSRGFPVAEIEVRLLFTRLYGNCVDRVHMQENVHNNDQPLFARLILLSITTVDRILNGRRVSKFRINGKHIWARKYERRGFN